jgi:hypothetical protein
MSTHIVEAYTDTHKIERIEEQRIQTMSDPKFQQWYKDMKVSQLYTNRELVHNANRMMEQWSGVDKNPNPITRLLRRLHAM